MQPVVFIGRGLFSSLRLWEAVKIAEKLRLYNLYFILQVHVCSLMSYARQAADAPEGRLFISDPPPPQRLQIAQENLAC